MASCACARFKTMFRIGSMQGRLPHCVDARSGAMLLESLRIDRTNRSLHAGVQELLMKLVDDHYPLPPNPDEDPAEAAEPPAKSRKRTATTARGKVWPAAFVLVVLGNLIIEALVSQGACSGCFWKVVVGACSRY